MKNLSILLEKVVVTLNQEEFAYDDANLTELQVTVNGKEVPLTLTNEEYCKAQGQLNTTEGGEFYKTTDAKSADLMSVVSDKLRSDYNFYSSDSCDFEFVIINCYDEIIAMTVANGVFCGQEGLAEAQSAFDMCENASIPVIFAEDLEKQIPYVYLVGYSDSYELNSTIKANERMIDFHDWFHENEPEHADIVMEQVMAKDLIAQIVKHIPVNKQSYNDMAEPIFIMTKKQSWLELSNCNLAADFYIGGSDETSISLIEQTFNVIPHNQEIN